MNLSFASETGLRFVSKFKSRYSLVNSFSSFIILSIIVYPQLIP
jgi:hypothetical protein